MDSSGDCTGHFMAYSTIPVKIQGLVLTEICQVVGIPDLNINLDASFLQLGANSLSAIVLASACKRHGLYLSVESILRCTSIFDLLACVTPVPLSSNLGSDTSLKSTANGLLNPKPKGTPGEKGSARTCTVLREEPKPTCSVPVPAEFIPSQMTSINTSMTEMQLSLIHGSQNHPGTNVISFFETYLSRDVPVMKAAWREVIQSESIFRMAFELSSGKCNLTAQARAPFLWTESVVHNRIAYELVLEKDPQETYVGTSFKVITLDEDSQSPNFSTIIWRIHHALIDGFAASLVYRKVRLAAAGRAIYPGTPFDRVAWDLQALQRSSRSANQLFWAQEKARYHSVAGELLLPQSSPRRASDNNATRSISLQIPVSQLSACAQESNVSLASLYYAAWALALSMYTDSDSVVFGIVLSGRNLPLAGAEDTIGPLVNTLPLHVTLNRDSTTTEYLRQIFNHMIELGSFQSSVPEDGYTRTFSSALAMEFEMLPSGNDGVQPVGKSYFRIDTDVPLSIFMSDDGTIRLCYHCKRYNKAAIELLGEHYRNALHALLTPDYTIEMCMRMVLPYESCKDLFRMGNCISKSTTASSVHDDLVTLFERTVSEYPDAVAIEKREQRFTYQEMDAMASRVANHISQYIQPGDVVCVHADRSINWIVAIYGILKAGGIYCALDAASPAHLRDLNFQSAGSKLFLTDDVSQMFFKPSSCSLCFAVQDVLVGPSSASEVTRRASPTPGANAYVCFTSGSTGKPKGVICSHEGLVAFQRDLEARLFAQPGRKISQIMSPAFDGSIHEIFSTLSYGATLVLADSADPFSHLRLVDSAILTPSIAKMLVPGDFPKLSNVYLVGEPVPQHVNDTWASEKRLYNMYGPTEGTCGATIKQLFAGQSVNIGVPNSSTRIYILDRHQRLIPPGVTGEIYIAGVQVARGYIGRPDETAKRFLLDSISDEAGERMYRTGDRGYWTPNGEIEYLGRNDRQIKLRGFRLDLNDLEIRMAQAAPAATAVAVASKDDYLVAMVQPISLDVSDFRLKISEVLPLHALPRHITPVDKFPITPAGKLDYNALANNIRPHMKPTVAPLSSPSERTLATVWREILIVGPDIEVTGDSTFFSLGGHSILQLHLASRLTTLFGRQIPFRLIIQSATLRDLAQAIDGLQSQETSAVGIVPGSALGEYEVSPMEREWWHKYQFDIGSSAFNLTFACAFDSQIVDRDRLALAWDSVMARHRILRCRFVADCQLGVRRVYADGPSHVQRVHNLDVWKEVNLPFQLARDNPIRVLISGDQLLVTISHIVCDLTTLQVLLKEVACLYGGATLSPLSRTYMDTTLWKTPASVCDLAFWSKQLSNAPSPSFPARTTYSGSSRICKIPTTIYTCLNAYAATHNFTMHQLALAAVALALSPLDNADTDIVLGGPFLNRPSAADLQTVGLFLEPLPIRIKYNPTYPASSPPGLARTTRPPTPETSGKRETGMLPYVHAVREASQSALMHAVPWTQLLTQLSITPAFPTHPLIDTMVTFHDERFTPKFAIEGVQPLLTWAQGAKFALLVEFLAVDEETLLLRLEFDEQCFEGGSIGRVHALILEALVCLLDGVAYEEVRERLKGVRDGEEESGEEIFGRPFSAL